MRNLRRLLFASWMLLFAVLTCYGQNDEGAENLRVSRSPLQLLASGVRFDGVREDPGDRAEEGLTYEGKLYTESCVPPDGFVVKDLATDSTVVYQPLELARAAGWIKRDAKYEVGNNIWGLHRSRDIIWMGTDGFGVLTFDTKSKLWSRYDVKAQPQPGRGLVVVFHADEDYVFAAGFHIFSVKRGKWLKVDAIPTRQVRRFGRSSETQITFDLSPLAKEKYLPLNERYSPLSVPAEVSLSQDGSAYIFEYEHSREFPTEFIIEKWQLDWAFSQMELGNLNEKSQQ